MSRGPRSPKQLKLPKDKITAPIRRKRFAYVVLFFCFWAGLISFKLVWLQVVQRNLWEQRAVRQQQGAFEVAPRRGVLYDRNLKELAMTVLVDSVYAVPSELGDNREADAELLAQIVHTDPNDNFTSEHQMLARFNASRGFAWVGRRLDAQTVERIMQLNLKGVYVQKEFKRFYPNNELAAQVLGYVGTDDSGLGGLEAKYDVEMHGEPGHMHTALDAKRHVLGSVENEPQPGENLVLSIDANIQYMAERALDAQMEKVKALHGTVVVQDPHTGQILALAVSPRFNPNDSRHIEPGTLTNLAVSDVYEPGSTFKLVTYSAALDAAGVEPTDIVDCQGGAITLFGRTIHDDVSDRGMHQVTVQRALEKSSDVAAVKMALKLGDDKFYRYIRAYGFGDRTGIELPSETRGLLRPPRRWSATSIGSLAIGQEIGVTPVQLVTMVSTIANGGVYMPPHILLTSTDMMKGDPRLQPSAFHPANELPAKLPDGAHRVITEMTSAKMRGMMAGIVTEGTGSEARLNGYSSAGKTGTAQKIDTETSTYSHTKLVASFAGFAPVSNPAISVAVIIDTPTVGASKYGGAVSAPVFAQVAQQVLEYLGVPHDQPLRTHGQMLAQAAPDVFDGAAQDNGADLNGMLAELHNLPEDDPLRKSGALPSAANQTAPTASRPAPMSFPETSRPAVSGDTTAKAPQIAPKIVPVAGHPASGGVVVQSGVRVSVPSFQGAALRAVIERAETAGLRIQPVGSGVATQQVPAAGTMVPMGTEVVVRFSR